MSKKKLLYFVSEDKYFLTHKLPHALIALKNGFDVLIVCKVSKFRKTIKSYGFEVKNINLDRSSLNFIKELKTIFELYKIFKNFKPNIIVNVALKPIIYGSICSKILDKFIDLKINSIVGLGYLFINRGLKVFIIRTIVKKILLFFINDSKTALIFQNIDDQNYFLNQKIIKSCKYKIIRGSGVDTDFFKPSSISKKYDLIMHCRMLKDKGVLELVEAINKLKKKKIFLHVLLIGNPDEKNLASIKKSELEKWNSDKTIHWLPEQKDILKYIQQSRIAVLPSYREGFPKSLLEAASCGLPIITNDVPGCREICINNFNGFLVQTKNSSDLSKKIESLIQDVDLIKKMGENSRKLVLKNFSQNYISKQFLYLYKKVNEFKTKNDLK